ncbi:hypothetical protein M1D55_07480 [Cupriavidus sp. JZ107]
MAKRYVSIGLHQYAQLMAQHSGMAAIGTLIKRRVWTFDYDEENGGARFNPGAP